MGFWAHIGRWFRREPFDPFELTKKVGTKVSEIEFSVYSLEADRNGITLEEWIRSTLNQGVTPETRHRLSSASGKEALDMAFRMIEDDDYLEGANTAPVLPLAPRKTMNKKLSGHPCFHLNAEIPPNFTANECQGVCTTEQPGFANRPCFWAPLTAKECPAFERKRVLPSALPAKAAH